MLDSEYARHAEPFLASIRGIRKISESVGSQSGSLAHLTPQLRKMSLRSPLSVIGGQPTLLNLDSYSCSWSARKAEKLEVRKCLVDHTASSSNGSTIKGKSEDRKPSWAVERP